MSKHQLVLVNPQSNSPSPHPRSGHRCVTDGIYLYVFGGFNPNTTTKLFSEIWCLNLSSKTWSKIETSGPSPPCVASSTLVLKRRYLIVFGGSGYPFGMHNSNKTYICDLRTRKWQEIDNGSSVDNSPSACYGQSAVVGPDNCMYVFGGTKGLEYNDDLHKLNMESYSWECIKSLRAPSSRYRHEAVCIENGFLVIGGYGEHGACALDKVFVFKYDLNVWEAVDCCGFNDNELPEPRRAHSCVQFNDEVYICGGYREMNSDANENSAYNDLWKLDLKTFFWHKIDQVLPFPRFFHSAAVTSKGCMYIFGGVQHLKDNVLARTNDVFKMWLVIPSLLELSWEMVCEIYPVSTSSFKSLASVGVPRYLISRCNLEY